MPDALDTCIDCGAICEDARCRQCWAKELLRQDAVFRTDAAADMADRGEDAVAEAERIMGVRDG